MTDLGGVQEFYVGQSILLTGATGFLGKVMVEKILRSCPNIKMLFLLVRTKKDKDPRQRLKDLFNSPLFDLMKKANPDYEKKITVITGDVSLPDIGLSKSDRKILTDEVTIVFHGAATVRFDERLKTATNINIAGSKRIVQLCGECKKLKVLLHISTAFSNCNNYEIKEMVYPPPIEGDRLIKIAETVPEDLLEILSMMITYDWPNTYSFTKQIAEDLVRSEVISKRIPCAIFRPAIVVGSYSEPIPGWIDNLYGPTAYIAGIGAGLVRALQTKIDLRAEFVPVDMTVNGALSVAWETAHRVSNDENGDHHSTETVPVYDFVTSENLPITWKYLSQMLVEHGYQVPTIKAVWFNTAIYTKYSLMFYVYHFLLHLIPATLVDAVLLAAGKEPQALKIYRKVQKFLNVLTHFSTNEWNFQNLNTIKLWKRLPDKDRSVFNFDMESLDRIKFFKNYFLGIRASIFEDPPETLPAARKRHFMLYLLHRLVQIIFFSTLIWFLLPLFSSVIIWIESALYSLQNGESIVSSSGTIKI